MFNVEEIMNGMMKEMFGENLEYVAQAVAEKKVREGKLKMSEIKDFVEKRAHSR